MSYTLWHSPGYSGAYKLVYREYRSRTPIPSVQPQTVLQTAESLAPIRKTGNFQVHAYPCSLVKARGYKCRGQQAQSCVMADLFIRLHSTLVDRV